MSRRIGERREGGAWYEDAFLPKVGPVALYGLLFTIVVLFALQSQTITSRPLDVARIALPLLAYFAIMWSGGYLLARPPGCPTHARPRWRSSPPATTSDWPSP
jgi:ACR3 family arsenite transporter